MSANHFFQSHIIRKKQPSFTKSVLLRLILKEIHFWVHLSLLQSGDGGFLQVPAAREVGLLHLCEFIEASLVGWIHG